MIHFMEHCILEHQSPPGFACGRFGVFAPVALFGQVVREQLCCHLMRLSKATVWLHLLLEQVQGQH